jgi:hypothetical protein
MIVTTCFLKLDNCIVSWSAPMNTLREDAQGRPLDPRTEIGFKVFGI